MSLHAKWIPALLLVTALSGCVHTLRPEDWNTAIPKGECTVRIVSPNREPAVEHYTADGRLLSGRGPVVDDGRGWFVHQYDARGRRIEVTEYEDHEHYSSPCEWLEGCNRPASRVIRRQQFFHDEAGRLIRKEDSKASYQLVYDKYWGSSERWQTRYTYDAEGRLVRTESGVSTRRLEYSDGRLVRGDLEYSDGKVTRLTAKYDSQGRLSETEERHCSAKTGQCYDTYPARFRYDDAGRLIRKDILYDKGDYSERSVMWEYDDRGLLTAFKRVKVIRRTGSTEGNTWKFTYDALGRFTASSVDGQPDQELVLLGGV